MVTDEMVEKALSSFNKTINEPIMVKCQRCDGRGYHHGFGEDGHDPDWCVECGGNQYDVAPGEESRAMRAALEAALSAAPPVAVDRQDGNRTLPYDRDTLGRFVREAWVRWAETQPDPKPSWLVPYEQLSEIDKEADRQIGEAVARWTLIGDAARYSKIKEHLDNIEATSDAISSPYRNSIIRKNALSALSALSAQVQDVAEERYRHKKRGSTYTVIARGRLQVDGDLDNEKVVVYRGEDGQTWVRPEYEFNDGRFEPLPAAPAKQEGSE